jgi:hypothetical protein
MGAVVQNSSRSEVSVVAGTTGNMDKVWRPRRDLNPCYRRERAAVYGKLLKLRDTDGFRKQFQ